jgi:hypothetical protein
VEALLQLAEMIKGEGGLLAAALRGAPVGEASAAARLMARGPRTESRQDEYALIVEAIHEGSLLHYGCSRLLEAGDRDLELLAGDRLYALGLERLVALGDLEAIAELADVISLVAVAHGQGDDDAADAAWEAGATAVGWGSSPLHAQAKAQAGTGRPGGAQALRAAAETLRAGSAPAPGRYPV